MQNFELSAGFRASGRNGNTYRFPSCCHTRIAVLALFLLAGAASAETWHGPRRGTRAPLFALLTQRLPLFAIRGAAIVAALGAVYGPYTGRCFAGPAGDRHRAPRRLVRSARQRALHHERGNAPALRIRPAQPDAGPDVNRNRKKQHDATQWMPSMNRCWFAARVVEVQRKYALTVDAREASSLDRVLSACASIEMIVRSCEAGRSTATPEAPQSVPSSGTTDALRLWDDNGNRRITCHKVGHPASPFMHDGEDVVCK